MATKLNPFTGKLDYTGGSGGGAWGTITGTLSDQADLQSALDAKFTLPSLTAGSVLFSDGSTIAEDNNNLNWNDTKNQFRVSDTLGSELVTNGDFSSATGWTAPTGWTISGGVANHGSNGTGNLTRTVSITAGYIYQIKFTILDYTTGTVSVSIGGYSSGNLSANGSYSVNFFATSTTTLVVTPSNTARFSIDDISVKRISGAYATSGRTGGAFVTGGADFGDRVHIYGADTTNVPNNANGLLNMYGSTYAMVKLYTTGTLRAAIAGSSSGLGLYGSNINLYSSTATTALSAYFTSIEARMYGRLRVAGLAGIAGGVTAGLESTSPLSTMNIYGSSAARMKYVSTDGYTLTANETMVLADVSTAAGCNGTPTACSSYVDSSTCNSHSAVGCSWSGGDCSEFTSQSLCEAQAGCTWSGYADCADFTTQSNCESYSGCSWYDSCNANNGNYSACVGTSGCSWDSYSSTCYGSGSCSGSYYVGYSCQGTYGSCNGTALCSNLGTEGACAGESGCSWSENMTLNLPQGSALSYGTVGSTMARHYYIKKVAGDGGVVVTPYSGDDIDGNTTYTIAAVNDAVHLYYAGLSGDCDDFTGSGQSTCESNAGCSWYDTCSVHSNETDCTNNSCTWDMSTNSCYGGTTTCLGTYVKNKRWHTISDKAISTIFAQTASKTVANTVTETTLVNTGVGNVIMPPNLLKVGKTIKIKMYAYHSSVSGATLRLKIKVGGATVIDTGAHNSHNDTNKLIKLESMITCRTAGASGTVLGQATFEEYGTTPDSNGVVNTSTSTVDTTSALTIDVTAQWGTASASNTITCTNLVIEVL